MTWTDPDNGFQTFLDKAADHPLLTAQQERDLSRRAKAGDKRAKDRLVECNIRLVLAISQNFKGKGLGGPDLVQEGIIGLHRAVEKFDPDLGYRFSTYATWWVRKSIQRGLAGAGSETIRLPVGVRQRRGEARSLMRMHPTWTIEEVAAEMEEEVAAILEALSAAEVVASMDVESWGDGLGGGSTLSDRLGDPNADDPHDLVSDTITPELLPALDELPDLERDILEMRFGLAGRKAQTVSEIADDMGKPVHFVQAAQRRALAALRVALSER